MFSLSLFLSFVSSFPLYKILPSVGLFSVERQYIKVDFPEPEGPMSPISPLSGRLRSKPPRAYTFSVFSISYIIVIFFISNIFVSSYQYRSSSIASMVRILYNAYFIGICNNPINNTNAQSISVILSG